MIHGELRFWSSHGLALAVARDPQSLLGAAGSAQALASGVSSAACALRHALPDGRRRRDEGSGGEERIDGLRRFLPYERGIPPHDTPNDVVNALEPDLAKACFANSVEILRDGDPEIVAIEITAIPLLLERLARKGALVTIDAIGTQVAIAETIVALGGDDLLAPKANRHATHMDVVDFFADPPPGMVEEPYETIETERRSPAYPEALIRDPEALT